MDKDILIKSLIRGIPLGLVSALVVIAFHVFTSEAGFTETLCSLYGILTLICLPVAEVFGYYYHYKKKEQ